MSPKPIPNGFHTVTPYLLVPGTSKLIDFLKQAFGAELLFRSERPDGVLMHGVLQIGDSKVMLAEATGDFPAKPCMVHLYVEDVDATYQRALQAGGTSLREPTTEFYGDRNGAAR